MIGMKKALDIYDKLKEDLIDNKDPISEDLCPKCFHIIAGHSERNDKMICHYEDDTLMQCGCCT